MWRNNLQESFSLITNHPWAQHLAVSLLIVICLHYYHSSSSVQTRRQTDIPNDLFLREEVEIGKKPRPILDNEVAPKAAPRKPKDSIPSRATTTTTQPSSSITAAIPPAFRTLSARLSAYWHWHDTEASLFRVYEIAQRNGDTFVAIPPFTPSSRRGNVRIGLRVTNLCATPIKVYWMDYQGREIWKGDILPRETWHQTTWIDHPWVFRQQQGELILYVVPYRVIPTCDMVPTVDLDDNTVGIHRFSIAPPFAPPFACSIHDPVLPFPAHQYLTTPSASMQWALVHCTRMGFRDWELLMQCGTKIIQQPNEPKYRSFRQSNPQFRVRLWNTTARGVLLAGGFYENEGYVQFGASNKLGRDEVQELSLWVWTIQKWIDQLDDSVLPQPTGADGFGRAGYGRAGQMNYNTQF
jgi:hypothetical protein